MYFKDFPTIVYRFNDRYIHMRDIVRNIRFQSILDAITLWDSYLWQDGDTLEIISEKLYGSPDYFFIICLANDIIDYRKDVPLTQSALQEYIAEKYPIEEINGVMVDTRKRIRHFEKNGILYTPDYSIFTTYAYFINGVDNNLVVYQINPDGSLTRDSTKDISLGTGGWQGGFAKNNYAYIIDGSANNLVVYQINPDGSLTRDSTKDISLGRGWWRGAFFNGDYAYIIDSNIIDSNLVVYQINPDGSLTRDSTKDISLGNGLFFGGFSNNNRAYIINFVSDNLIVYQINSDGTIDLSNHPNIPIPFSGITTGAFSNNTHFYLIIDIGNVIVYRINSFGGRSRESDKDISLGSIGWQGGFYSEIYNLFGKRFEGRMNDNENTPVDAVPVTNEQWEDRQNEAKRILRIPHPNHLPFILNEFKRLV